MGTEIVHTANGDYTVTTTYNGLMQGVYNVSATASRSIVTADVLDYDGYMGNYALIWKKVTISHNQTQTGSGTAQTVCSYHETPLPVDNVLVYDDTSAFTTSCTRTVDFYLTYNIAGKKFEKLLCSCSEQGSDTSHSYSGTRVWGASIQVKDDFIVYQFRKEVPSDRYKSASLPNFLDGYDSCYGFESWTTDRDEHDLWKLESFIVGLINIKDGVGSKVGYLKEEEYTLGEEGSMLSRDEVYSVGVVNE